jgi:hypothetical protein
LFMAPPIGSEVLYTEIKTAKVYGYTPDGRVRIKDKPGPGRPKHVPLERVQSTSHSKGCSRHQRRSRLSNRWPSVRKWYSH